VKGKSKGQDWAG